MTPRVLPATLVLWLVSCGGGTPSPREPSPPPTPEAVVVQVTGAVEQWRQALEVRSVDALAPLYASEATWIHQGRVVRGWPAIKDAHAAFFNANPQVKVLVADLQVAALGSDGAAATAAVSRRYGDGVTTIEEIGAAIWVFRRDDAGWKIVAEQYGYPASAQ